MGNAMLQDIMDHDFRVTGKRKNGLFAGLYSLITIYLYRLDESELGAE
jgi:hypothetical protein